VFKKFSHYLLQQIHKHIFVQWPIPSTLVPSDSTIDHWRSWCRGLFLWPTPYIHSTFWCFSLCFQYAPSCCFHGKYVTYSGCIRWVDLGGSHTKQISFFDKPDALQH
jgi:hypothetical protein